MRGSFFGLPRAFPPSRALPRAEHPGTEALGASAQVQVQVVGRVDLLPVALKIGRYRPKASQQRPAQWFLQ